MKNEQHLAVVRSDGVRGTLTPAQPRPNGELQMRAVFADGVEMLVPNTTLVRQSDGTFLLPDQPQARSEHTAATPLVVPVIEETATVTKRQVDTGGVRVRKIVREHHEAIEEPLLQEHVDVERVSINDWVPEGVSLAPR